MFIMAKSFIDRTGDGSTTLFTFSFNYLDSTHIGVTVDGSAVPFSFTTSHTVEVTPAPANGAIVRIQRTTPTTPVVDFKDGETLSEEDLDKVNLQGLYLAEESADSLGETLVKGSDTHVDLGGSRLKNVGDPVDASDAVTKQWAETALDSDVAQAEAAKTSAENAAITATARAGEAAVDRTAAETAKTAAEAAQAAAETAKTGAETAETNAGNSASTATTKASEAASSASAAAGGASTAVTKAAEAAASASTASTKATEAAASAAAAATFDPDNFVAVAGDTMTGPLNLPAADPTADDEAARKKYVDDQVATRLTQAAADLIYAPRRRRVLFNGFDASLRGTDGINVIRNGAGDYTLTFTTAAANTNYGVNVGVGTPGGGGTGARWHWIEDTSFRTLTGCRIKVVDTAGTAKDFPYVSVEIVW